MKPTPKKLVLAISAFVLLAAACSSDDDDATVAASTSTTTAEGTTTTAHDDAAMDDGMDDMAMMELPDFANDMHLAVTAPDPGSVLTDNEITLTVEATGFELACDQAGKPVAEGVGHYHVELDHSLVDMYCTDQATVSMQNVSPGEHTITLVPAINDHNEVHDNAVELTFDYQPTSPLPELTDATFDADPSIKIISPKPGDVVSGEFDVVVEIENFNASCDLYGKPGLFGYGHWHVNLDTDEGPMMGMGTMLGMSCTDTFKASTDGLQSGETHSVIALLVDNGHAPFNPGIRDSVDVVVG